MEGVPPDYLEEFKDNIRSITTAVRYSAEVVPQRLAELSKQLAESFDVYKTAGPSRPQPGRRSEGISGYSSLSGTTDAVARRRLAMGEDAYENEMEGGAGTGPHAASGWRGRVQQQGLGDILPLPRYPGAEPNARDLLNYMSVVSANLAQKRQGKLDTQADATRQAWLTGAAQRGVVQLDDQGRPLGPLTEDVQGQLDALAPPETRLGKVSNLFASAEDAYAQGRYIRGIVSKVTRPLNNMRNLGYQTGYEGGNPMFMGFRAPWDGALWQGISQRASEIPFAMSNNVTPGQANGIYQNLYGLGWMGGSQTNSMRTAAAQMMQQNPYVASMPQYYQMMDKATRLGASSLQHFNDVMKSLPDSAKAAHVSIAQTMADMDQLGQMNKGMGGTYAAGLENATQWQNVTGLPANVMSTLMQNPMVQGQTFLRTGLMPWEQGLASPGQHIQSIMGAVNMLGGIVNKPSDISTPIGTSGFFNNVSGQDQKEALMSHFLGVDKATVHTMLSNPQGYAAGAQIGDEASAYAAKVRTQIRSGDSSGAYHTFAGQGAGTYGQLSSDISKAVDPQGHKLFEDWDYYRKIRHMGVSDTKAHQMAQAYAQQQVDNAGKATPGHWETVPTRGGSVRKWVGSTNKDMANAAEARARTIEKYQAMNRNEFGPGGTAGSGPQLTIELGPAAKKIFHLTDPNNQQKAGRNAGSVDINTNSWANGPTSSPQPNLDTAGSSGTYNYGSQYDTGGY